MIGSSPHTWGILDSVTKEYDSTRFIPTYVGHTLRKCSSALRSSVHPHIRGAYEFATPCYVGQLRFIPTYVGHTKKLEIKFMPGSVHPHIRGAYA